jgi:superfamily II DNA/RNA helicase
VPSTDISGDGFGSLGLSDALRRAARACGFERPTPVQAGLIPLALQGDDLLVSAQTGSGKTVAYGLPLLQHLLQHHARNPVQGRRIVQALVLVPTRDLAVQVGQVLRELAIGLPERLKIELAFGGVSINPQMMALRGGADLVVATPGRLLDLAAHHAIQLGGLRCLVLDEADRLLEMGFAEELAAVRSLLPARRQNLLLSATLPAQVESLAGEWLHEPRRLTIEQTPETRPDIVQRAIEVDPPRRAQLLRSLIRQEAWPRALVFVASRYGAELVSHKLDRAGIESRPFHADFSQGARAAVLSDFHAGRIQVMVATDVAARGIDIEGLEVVVNFDLPRSPLDYQHRIGRTGRAGRSGVAVSFVSPGTEGHFRLIEKRQGMRVAREQVAGFEPSQTAAVPADQDGPAMADGIDPNGGIKGRRKSKKDKLRESAARAPGRAGSR